MLSISDLHSEIEKRETRKSKIYESVLNKCQNRIITTNQKTNDCYCLYVVPTFMFGVPLYNMSDCIVHIMKDLTNKGFKLNYTHPNFLYISWIEKPTKNETKKMEQFKLIDDVPKESLIYHQEDIKNIGNKTNYLFYGLEDV
jgi:hypothetical protein